MDDNANDPTTLPGRKTPATATAGQGPLALGSPGRDRIHQALDMRDARQDDEGTPHRGPLALSVAVPCKSEAIVALQFDDITAVHDLPWALMADVIGEPLELTVPADQMDVVVGDGAQGLI